MATVATASPPSLEHGEARAAAQAYLKSRLTAKNSASERAFNIPVIDISPSFSSSLEDRKAVAVQIRDACENSGFFQITGHGVPAESRAAVLKQAERFFKLTVDKKDALHIKHSKYMRGWEPSDASYVNPADWTDAESVPETKEGFNWAYEEALDLTGGDGQYAELDGAMVNGNVWPAEEDLPGFFEGIKNYYSKVMELARHMFRLFALSLDLPEDYFDPMMTHPGAIARLMYYPPSKDPKPLDPNEKDKEVGLGAHSDYECFTLLLCSSPTGLEVLSPDNVWTPATAVEGSFIVNVADFLMRWTNDRYKSTVHRVVNRTTETRYSVPFFFSINYDQVVETLPSCVSPENPSKYPKIKAGEYILQRLLATLKED